MLCPVCETTSTDTQKCIVCGWEFINFTEEPTKEEQNEYTQLLHNYKTEFFFALAVQYHDNKQYEESIECCRISCKHQSFENPLALMASAYLELENKEEALTFAAEALVLNPQNQLALEILLKLSPEKDLNTNAIKKLTSKMLIKDKFETTQEYINRINNIGYVSVGTVKWIDYDADNSMFEFEPNLIFRDPKLDSQLYLDLCDCKYTIEIQRDVAKQLYEKNNILLIAKIAIKDDVLYFTDILVDIYSFTALYEDVLDAKKIQKEQEEVEKKHNMQRIIKKSNTPGVGLTADEHYLLQNFHDTGELAREPNKIMTSIGKGIASFIRKRI